MKMGMNTGAKMAHFGTTPGRMKSRMHDHQDEADQQGETADVGRLEQIGHLDRGDPGMLRVVEVGDELADHQEHEDQAGQTRQMSW